MSRVLTKARVLKPGAKFFHKDFTYEVVARHHHNTVYTALWCYNSAGQLETLSIPHDTFVVAYVDSLVAEVEACEIKAHDSILCDDVYVEVARVIRENDNEVTILQVNSTWITVAVDMKVKVIR